MHAAELEPEQKAFTRGSLSIGMLDFPAASKLTKIKKKGKIEKPSLYEKSLYNLKVLKFFKIVTWQ